MVLDSAVFLVGTAVNAYLSHRLGPIGSKSPLYKSTVDEESIGTGTDSVNEKIES